jgi:hypothetical protein
MPLPSKNIASSLQKIALQKLPGLFVSMMRLRPMFGKDQALRVRPIAEPAIPPQQRVFLARGV